MDPFGSRSVSKPLLGIRILGKEMDFFGYGFGYGYGYATLLILQKFALMSSLPCYVFTLGRSAVALVTLTSLSAFSNHVPAFSLPLN